MDNGKLKTENLCFEFSVFSFPFSVLFHTNLRAENFCRNVGKLSSAIGGRKPDIARVCQKCSSSRRTHRKKIRDSLYPHTTTDSIFAAAICKADSEFGCNLFCLILLFFQQYPLIMEFFETEKRQETTDKIQS
jgi:hypothetical protein